MVYWSRESSSTVDLHVLGTSVIITETSSVQRTFKVTISKVWISLLLKWKWALCLGKGCSTAPPLYQILACSY